MLHAEKKQQACLPQQAGNQAQASCVCILLLHIGQQITKRYVWHEMMMITVILCNQTCVQFLL